MNSERLKEKIIKGENETFELKEDIRDPLILSNLISAFSNNLGGQIVIGVREPIEIIGTDTDKLQKMVGFAKLELKPLPDLTSQIVTIDNKKVFVIDIKKSDRIVFSAGSVFQRIGDQIRPMNAEVIKSKLTKLTSDDKSLSTLAIAIEKQSQTINDLREEIKNSNSWKSKTKDNLISGIIGALLGLVLTLLFT